MEGYGAALGKRFFVDVWALEGFIPFWCESPADIQQVWGKLSDPKLFFVLVEESWWNGLPFTVRRRAVRSPRPVWITLPDMTAQEVL